MCGLAEPENGRKSIRVKKYKKEAKREKFTRKIEKHFFDLAYHFIFDGFFLAFWVALNVSPTPL